MIQSISGVRDDRKWFYLGLRHLRMAFRLLRSGFADGAVFHAYHCYECLLSAVIAANGYPVPPEGWTRIALATGVIVEAYRSPEGFVQDRNAHRARIILFDQLVDQTRPYRADHQLLRTYLRYQVRLDALYYDPSRAQLPEDAYTAKYAVGVTSLLLRFSREVRKEIA